MAKENRPQSVSEAGFGAVGERITKYWRQCFIVGIRCDSGINTCIFVDIRVLPEYYCRN